MDERVNLGEKLALIDERFGPKIVAAFNDHKRNVELGPGELFIVPRGVEHCPRADEEAHVLLIEPLGTANTGDAGGARTAAEERI
jgi:mannose-6-phosphate isomerase-like protein (cupin superfamily)